ncbi:hypothetical protein E4U32_005124 [Claviceps aff. humidiphila group G2b]|nr:hypothetical protein E4U32_005124 [Claviceps aff. humidiphila group G2b]
MHELGSSDEEDSVKYLRQPPRVSGQHAGPGRPDQRRGGIDQWAGCGCRKGGMTVECWVWGKGACAWGSGTGWRRAGAVDDGAVWRLGQLLAGVPIVVGNWDRYAP